MSDKIPPRPWHIDEGGDVRDADGNYALSIAGVDALAHICALVNAELEVVAALERIFRLTAESSRSPVDRWIEINTAALACLALLRGDAPAPDWNPTGAPQLRPDGGYPISGDTFAVVRPPADPDVVASLEAAEERLARHVGLKTNHDSHAIAMDFGKALGYIRAALAKVRG